MQKRILNAIKDIEKEKEVKILYACESGSRAWGFSSVDSDYDVRFIFVHPRDYYLSVFEDKKDVIELPINDLLDINGWDLKKVLYLLYKNNLALFEWINSPITYLDLNMKEDLCKIVNQYFRSDRAHYHYFSMASGFYKNHIIDTARPNLKKLFYCLRATFSSLWIEKFKQMPPVDFTKMLIPELANEAVLEEIRKLMEEKLLKGEKDSADHCNLIPGFLSQSLLHLSSLKPSGHSADAANIDIMFKKILSDIEVV